MKINELPDDQILWLVKWIDRYTLPHLTTRSASVRILLQQLRQTEMREVSKLSKDEVAGILGAQPKARKQSNVNNPHENLDFKECVIHVGSLPLVFVGFIFKAKELVGLLPTNSYNIRLSTGREDGKRHRVADTSTPPIGWDKNYPHYALNNYEFTEVKKRFPRSQFYIFHGSNEDYIVPCQVIFQTFYAPDTQMARAFTSGPWHETAKQVIFFGVTKGGLTTHINPITGHWNVIIETRVKDIYARHLAILWWDEYAKARAEEIYARAIQERGSSITGYWHSQANFPFRNDASISLRVTGYELRQWSLHNATARPRILVTRITGSEEPFYIPSIHWQRVNSGDDGLERVKQDAVAPYSQTPETNELDRPDENSVVSAEHDSSKKSTLQDFGVGTFEWKFAKDIAKLKKLVSGVYDKGGQALLDPRELSSTGDPNYQNDSLGQLEAHVLVRDPVNRFTQLIDALRQLQESNAIDEFNVVPPDSATVLELRGALSCWNFLTDVERSTGKIHKRSWRIMSGVGVKQEKNNLSKRGQVRTALIVEIFINGNKVYWIEIEGKSTEAFRSPVLLLNDFPSEDFLLDLLHTIAGAKGVGTDKKLRPLLNNVGEAVSCYKHWYQSAESVQFDIASVNRFLGKLLRLN